MNENLHRTDRANAQRNPADDLSARIASRIQPTNEQDDRYPGSFFRIPGIPAPGKTTWSLVK